MQRFFSAYHSDNNIIKKSASGGAFTALTDCWFSKHASLATVYGCVLDEELKANHIRAVNKGDRDKMRGSKYIASEISGVFRAVAKDISENRYVLFSGTPCQISGLLSYLDKMGMKNDNLLTVEVLCHGVGSNLFFEDYIAHLEKRYKSKAIKGSFCAKKRPGKLKDIEIVFENGKTYNAASTKYDWFSSVYFSNYILRPSCLKCKFATPERNADISIADDWGRIGGVKQISRSLIISNTDKGYTWVANACEHMNYEEISPSQVNQLHMHSPAEKPTRYDEFWQIYTEKGYLGAQKYVGNNTPSGRVKSIVVRVLYTLHLSEAIKLIKEKLK